MVTDDGEKSVEQIRTAMKKGVRKRTAFVNKITQEGYTYFPLFVVLFTFIFMYRHNKETMLMADMITERSLISLLSPSQATQTAHSGLCPTCIFCSGL